MSEKTSGKPELNLQIIRDKLGVKRDMDKIEGKLLIIASQKGKIAYVKFLIENGADVHAMNDEALRWASENGHFEVVRFLVKNGANVHAMNDEALRWASENGHLEVASFLKDNFK